MSPHNTKGTGESSASHVTDSKYPQHFEEAYLLHQIFNPNQTHLFWKKIQTCMFISEKEKTSPSFKNQRMTSPFYVSTFV
jgi:hypothetical protein